MPNFLPDRQSLRRKGRDGRIGVGILVALLGIVMLLKTLGIMPGIRDFGRHAWAWAFVAAGIFSILHSRFRNPAGFVFLAIGGAHLIGRFEVINGVYSDQLIWPVGIIALGLLLIFRKRKPKRYPAMKNHDNYESVSDASLLNIDVTFGGRKEVITAKNFQGGRVAATFAGVELNLMQAETTGTSPMVLDMHVNFAGCEIIVPANWEIQNEVAPTFGSVEDNRGYRAAPTVPGDGGRRLLVLRGRCTCGSIEIKAY